MDLDFKDQRSHSSAPKNLGQGSHQICKIELILFCALVILIKIQMISVCMPVASYDVTEVQTKYNCIKNVQLLLCERHRSVLGRLAKT